MTYSEQSSEIIKVVIFSIACFALLYLQRLLKCPWCPMGKFAVGLCTIVGFLAEYISPMAMSNIGRSIGSNGYFKSLKTNAIRIIVNTDYKMS